jgi:hypothetical protein
MLPILKISQFVLVWLYENTKSFFPFLSKILRSIKKVLVLKNKNKKSEVLAMGFSCQFSNFFKKLFLTCSCLALCEHEKFPILVKDFEKYQKSSF